MNNSYSYCDSCDYIVHNTDTYRTTEDLYICYGCYEAEYLTCESCGLATRTYDDDYICENCRDFEPKKIPLIFCQKAPTMPKRHMGLEIEIESLSVEELQGGHKTFSDRVRSRMLDYLMGRKRGVTIIGPATLVKEIKKNPENISLKTK